MRAEVQREPPRRLALVIDGLPEKQPDVTEEKKGPRVGAPDDIAAMVAMLLSDDSQYVNGQSISVNGGWYMT